MKLIVISDKVFEIFRATETDFSLLADLKTMKSILSNEDRYENSCVAYRVSCYLRDGDSELSNTFKVLENISLIFDQPFDLAYRRNETVSGDETWFGTSLRKLRDKNEIRDGQHPMIRNVELVGNSTIVLVVSTKEDQEYGMRTPMYACYANEAFDESVVRDCLSYFIRVNSVEAGLRSPLKRMLLRNA